MVYQSDCRYLPYSIHFSEFMPIFFKNTRSPPFSYETKMAADGYLARKALILREIHDQNSSLRAGEGRLRITGDNTVPRNLFAALTF